MSFSDKLEAVAAAVWEWRKEKISHHDFLGAVVDYCPRAFELADRAIRCRDADECRQLAARYVAQGL